MYGNEPLIRGPSVILHAALRKSCWPDRALAQLAGGTAKHQLRSNTPQEEDAISQNAAHTLHQRPCTVLWFQQERYMGSGIKRWKQVWAHLPSSQ